MFQFLRFLARDTRPSPVAQAPAPLAGGPVARLLQGQRRQDKPCLTPIECVQERRCAGHCGVR